MSTHLLNLLTLASEDIEPYRLLRFEGHEAISAPFEYRLEIVTQHVPDVKSWIGELVEFSISRANDDDRKFAGRIFETRVSEQTGEPLRITLVARPAYYATSYARGMHFIQDRNAIDVFKAITGNVPGLVTDVSASTPPTRAYLVRYDESEMDYLDRLLAQEGVMYFFVYDSGGGPYKHKMVIASAASAYKDLPDDDGEPFQPGLAAAGLGELSGSHFATAGGRRYHAFDVNKLDTPFAATGTITPTWASVYAHQHEDLTGGALASAELTTRGTAHADSVSQDLEVVSGSGDDVFFMAGGRFKTNRSDGGVPARLVLTSVSHSAYDPSALNRSGGEASYHNSFTAIDASLVYRPTVPNSRRRAYGPVLGLVKDDSSPDGQVKVDSQSRIPVQVEQVFLGDPNKPFAKFVWLPVSQQWASGTHGAQFFPRIGSRVIVDFLYGDPDLPFVSGTIYTPTAKYPFDPASNATQTGWRSVTDKNGSIKQELMFEDKPGGEEVYLYTGRDYRRQIDHDEMGTIKNDRTITVEHDHTETVKNDQTVTVEHDQSETVNNDQTITVKNNRAVKVTGQETHDVDKTRTVTVLQKNLLESKQEIEIKVGSSSIKLTLQGIEITAPTIKINSQTTLDVQAGAQAQYKAPMIQVNADAMLVLKGGIVMIN